MGFQIALVLLVGIICVHGTSQLSKTSAPCRIDLGVKNAPFISSAGILSKTNGHLEFMHGEKLTVSCGNYFLEHTEHRSLELTCDSGSLVNSEYDMAYFSDITCQKDGRAGEIITRTGTCYNNYTEAIIAFPNTPSYTNFTVCHNEELDETLYVKHYIYGARLNQSESGNRPDFKEGDFYPTISTDNCYKQVNQTETLGLLLNSTFLASQYIQTGANLFWSRGHLAPNGDQISANEKYATFYFINASPQWQTINGGNWNQLEIKSRDLARGRGATFTVWTGSHEILSLTDMDGVPVEIWLGRNSTGALVRKLPVNKFTWKVIYDERANQAIAVIQINNPWEAAPASQVFCPNLCSQLSWITWNITDKRLGYTFCCDVESFQNAVPFAPTFENAPTLLN